MNNKEFLEKIKNNEISIDQGLDYLKDFNYKDLDFAKLDFQRKERRGFGETIFCEGKEDFALAEIYKSFSDRKESVIGTRATPSQYEKVLELVPEAKYNPTARIISLVYEQTPKIGNIAICTGGTADLKVAEEARITAEFFGANVSKFYDVGVSGLHRLTSKIDEISKANVIIAIAGMEGALPTVIGGLVNKPIIAVPTSIGYGANFEGLAALLTMLNTCAEGVNVVNIDNGYSAAYNACQINRLIEER